MKAQPRCGAEHASEMGNPPGDLPKERAVKKGKTRDATRHSPKWQGDDYTTLSPLCGNEGTRSSGPGTLNTPPGDTWNRTLAHTS